MLRVKRFWLSMVVTLMILAGAGFSMHQTDALAGAEIIGNAHGSSLRALITTNGSSKVSRIVYFDSGSHSNPGANTPVASGSICGNAVSGTYHYAEVQLTGTLAGTNPTLAIKWQNSKDNGTTWSDVGTWTTINATVTPATQSNTVSDHPEEVLMNANTPVVTPAVVYGDCWRVTYTYGGTSALGSFKIIGLDK